MSGRNHKSYPAAVRGTLDGPRAETRAKVLAALAKAPGTHTEIARRAGLNRSTVASALRWMQAHGEPVASNDGIWRLDRPARVPSSKARYRPYELRSTSQGPQPKTRERLAAALDQGPVSPAEIARRTGLNPQTVDLTLRYLRRRGEVERWYVPGVKGLVAGWKRDMPEGAPRSSAEATLQAGRSWRTAEQIARLVGLEKSNARKVLQRLVAEGRMKRSRGFYRTVGG